MDKYVGEAERNIRDVFKDAELEWAKFGEQVRVVKRKFLSRSHVNKHSYNEILQ